MRYSILAGLCVAVCASACGAADSITPDSSIASLTISPAETTLVVGEIAPFSITARDKDGNVVTPSSLDVSETHPGILRLNSDSTILAMAIGTDTVSIKAGSASARAVVVVTAATGGGTVASLRLDIPGTSYQAGDAAFFVATPLDQNGVPVGGQTVSWETSAPAIATVLDGGYFQALSAGTATITATCGSVTAQTTVTIAPASGQIPPWPQQPSGFTQITETSFATITEGGWTPYYSIGTTTDSTAPKSPPNVGQVFYPAGFNGGDSPGLLEYLINGSPQSLYVSFWLKLSDNWRGHLTGTNKIMHFWVGGLNRVLLYADGAGNDVLLPSVGLQGVVNYGVTAALKPNLVPSATVVRGAWQRWEVVIHGNSSGQADGYVEWWVNGVKVGRYTGIQYTSGASSFSVIKWDPTWGGLGDTVPADQYMRMDHLYVSGQ